MNFFRQKIEGTSKEPDIEQKISEVLHWAKDKGYLDKLDISADSAERLFKTILIEHNLPQELKSNTRLKKELEQAAIKKAGEQLPLPLDEGKRLVELVETGEMLDDVFYSINTLFSGVIKAGQLSTLDERLKSVFNAAIHLPKAVLSDLSPKSAFDQLSRQIEQVKQGQSPDDPAILNETLKTIYSIAAVGNTIDLVNELLAPENETLRIALLVYARLNGVNLEQKDIDELRETVLQQENPKLGSLVDYLVMPENSLRLAGGQL